jgi:hypothetical protein
MEATIVEETKIPGERKAIHANRLLIVLIAYCSASLFHFVHNAVFITDYPNLPGWITTAGVYITWIGITAIGLTGFLLIRHGKRLPGLIVVAVHGAIGLDGLGHYSLAPVSAHTIVMNLTIWLEAITATLVLIVVAGMMVNHFRNRPGTAFG